MTRSEAKPAFAAVNKLFREEPGWTARDRSRCDAGVAGSRDDRRARGRERRARGRLAQLPLRLLHPHPRHPGRQARAARAAGPAAFSGRGGRIEKPAPRVSQAGVGHPLTCAISIAVFSDFNGLRRVPSDSIFPLIAQSLRFSLVSTHRVSPQRTQGSHVSVMLSRKCRFSRMRLLSIALAQGHAPGPARMTRRSLLPVNVGDVEGRVATRSVDFNLVNSAVVFERDGRAAILDDVERFIDRVDEGHRVADSGPRDLGAVHFANVGAAFAEFALSTTAATICLITPDAWRRTPASASRRGRRWERRSSRGDRS